MLTFGLTHGPDEPRHEARRRHRKYSEDHEPERTRSDEGVPELLIRASIAGEEQGEGEDQEWPMQPYVDVVAPVHQHRMVEDEPLKTVLDIDSEHLFETKQPIGVACRAV